jgi:glycosyltransferase involved in cell wall biosynthesis
MRILMSPRRSNKNSIGIFLQRVTEELLRRHYKVTGQLSHYTAIELLPWQQAFMFGTPRRLTRIIHTGKPFVVTIGRPEIQSEDETLGFAYLPEHEEQEKKMADAILRATKVAFISSYVRSVWQEIFLRRKSPFPEFKTSVVHHGVNLNLFAPDFKQRAGPFVIGMAGQFRRWQGLAVLFEVSRRLPFPHRLMLIGSMTPAFREAFNAGMSDPAVAARTTHVPWVDQKDLPHFYRQMHCFFHPNIGEPFGIVVAEALACGVPVVCPQYGGPAEFVLPNGGVAVRSEPWNYGPDFVEEMERAVLQIYRNQAAYAEGARQQATKHLSIGLCVDKYLDLMCLPRIAARE